MRVEAGYNQWQSDCSFWKGPKGAMFTCVILTTTPNELTGAVHDRMPAILAGNAEAIWLDPTAHDPELLMQLLGPYPADEMEAHPANPAMNKATFEGPECLTASGTA